MRTHQSEEPLEALSAVFWAWEEPLWMARWKGGLPWEEKDCPKMEERG